MQWETFLADEKATVELGKTLGSLISSGIVVYLEGMLGAGKTTFCQGVLSAYNHSGRVKSPTYTLVEPYDLNDVQLYHFDLYRLGDPEELEFMGIRDYFTKNSIALIEWPEKGRGFIPTADLTVSLNPLGEGRKLNINSETERGVAVLSLLQTKDV